MAAHRLVHQLVQPAIWPRHRLGSASQARVEPSTSPNSNVTVPVGNTKIPSPTAGSPHRNGRTNTGRTSSSLITPLCAPPTPRTSAKTRTALKQTRTPHRVDAYPGHGRDAVRPPGAARPSTTSPAPGVTRCHLRATKTKARKTVLRRPTDTGQSTERWAYAFKVETVDGWPGSATTSGRWPPIVIVHRHREPGPMGSVAGGSRVSPGGTSPDQKCPRMRSENAARE